MRPFVPALALVLALATPAAAQQDVGKRIEAAVFAPELVIKHAREINLTAEQRKAITSAVGSMQGELLDLQVQLGEAAEAVAAALEQPRVAEADLLQKLDRTLDLERQVKRRQMQLVLRIRNTLTPEQQARLRELRGRG